MGIQKDRVKFNPMPAEIPSSAQCLIINGTSKPLIPTNSSSIETPIVSQSS
ncbi:hypothetical protein CsSME_00025425 [Camellia sinensis var. sinensis]